MSSWARTSACTHSPRACVHITPSYLTPPSGHSHCRQPHCTIDMLPWLPHTAASRPARLMKREAALDFHFLLLCVCVCLRSMIFSPYAAYIYLFIFFFKAALIKIFISALDQMALQCLLAPCFGFSASTFTFTALMEPVFTLVLYC